MTSIGWYCIEVTTDEIANQVFLEENIDVNKIDNKIYWLNKQPILAGQKLLFSDWTAINITPSNAKYRMLKAGIYWYQVVVAGSSSSTSVGCYGPKINILLDMNADVLINIIQTDQLVYPKFIENAGWKTELGNYKTYQTYGPPQLASNKWVPDTNGGMLSILHNSKAYIGWELDGNFIYDYTKEYTLTYTTFTDQQGRMNIEDEGDTFANDVIAAKQALGYTNLDEFDVKARFGFTYFEKREVIKIYSGSEEFYLFNHADLNMPTMNEISFIRNLFTSRTPTAVTDADAKILFNQIIQKYWTEDDTPMGGTFYPKLVDKFSTDVSDNVVEVYILNSGQKMIGTGGDITNSEYESVKKVPEAHRPFYGWKSNDVNEKTANKSYYYLAKGTLFDEDAVEIVDINAVLPVSPISLSDLAATSAVVTSNGKEYHVTQSYTLTKDLIIEYDEILFIDVVVEFTINSDVYVYNGGLVFLIGDGMQTKISNHGIFVNKGMVSSSNINEYFYTKSDGYFYNLNPNQVGGGDYGDSSALYNFTGETGSKVFDVKTGSTPNLARNNDIQPDEYTSNYQGGIPVTKVQIQQQQQQQL